MNETTANYEAHARRKRKKRTHQPQNLSGTLTTPKQILLSWSTLKPAHGYKIYEGEPPQEIQTLTEYQDPKAINGTVITILSNQTPGQKKIRVSAFNTYQESKKSDPIIITVPEPPDTEPPTTPTNFRTENVRGTFLTLKWNQSTDNKGISHYKITRNGQPLITLPNTATQLAEINLSTSTRYEYTIEAFDTSGNKSQAATTITITQRR